jgi:hypothetical protein
MGFFLFLLVTATLLIRPAEQMPELYGAHLYETFIVLCFAFSMTSILDQFSLKSLENRPITLCVFGLLLAVVISHLAQGNADKAAMTGFEFAKAIVYYLLLVGNVNTAARLRIFVGCLGICAVLFVVLSILQYHEVIVLPQPQPYVLAGDRAKGSETSMGAYVKDMEWDPVSGQNVEFKRLRGTGIFRDPNDLCLLLAMGLFIALYGFTDRAQGVFRLAWLPPLVLFIYALALTYSRGGVMGLLAGCLVLCYARYGWRGTLLMASPLLAGAIVLIGGRMGSLATAEGTGQTRIQIWSDGLDQLRSSPLFGVGMNELGDLVGKAAHNSFLHAYAELGLFGGTFFLGAFLFALQSLNRILTHRQYLADPEMRRLVPFLMAMLVAYIVGILSLSRVETVPTYMMLGLVTAFAHVAMVKAPGFALRLDGRLVQRWALASVGFLMATYMVVRVFRA